MIYLPIPGSHSLSKHGVFYNFIIRTVFITIDEPVAGIPDEASLIKSYALQRNLKLPLVGLQYFQALSCYRLASIVQGVYARSVWGNASDEESAQYLLGMVKPLAQSGLAFTRCVHACVCACVRVPILNEYSVCYIRVFYGLCYILPVSTVLPSHQHLI